MSKPLKTESEWETAAAWAANGPVALATVVSTWGSAPRPKGSLLVVRGDGAFAGSVSGGCIEGAVVTEAQDVIEGGAPKLMEFGVTDEQAWDVGLACGGQISVLVEAAGKDRRALLERLNRARAKGEDAVLATRVRDGASHLFAKGERAVQGFWKGVERIARAALSEEEPRLAQHKGEQVFINVFPAPYRLYLIGAVHISQALAPLAAAAGYRVTVIDPRGAFTEREGFAGVTLIEDWPDDALARERLDRHAAVVTLTHDPKLDDVALKVALNSEAFYVGSLGSSRTHGKRLERLKEMAFTKKQLSRIHGPVGLKIGAKTPFEIALSILAELTMARRTGKAGMK